MKLTKSKLKQLIKEELQTIGLLNETPQRIAHELYNAIEGWGTEEEEIERAFTSIQSVETAIAVDRAFSQLLKSKGEEGDLASWLDDDGMEKHAEAIKGALEGVKTSGETSQSISPDAAKRARAGAGAAALDPNIAQLTGMLQQIIGKEKLQQNLVTIIRSLMQKQGQ
jgi:hypothetical protein